MNNQLSLTLPASHKRSADAPRLSMATQSKSIASGFDCSALMHPRVASPVRYKERHLLLERTLRSHSQTRFGGQVVECRPRDRDRFNRRVAVCSVGGERHPDQSQYNVSKYSIIPPATEWAQRTKHLRNASERGNRPEISGSA